MSVPRFDAPILKAGQPRPTFSIMIPVRDPTEHLDVTLRSVLAERLGPEDAQIAVVDDGSAMPVEDRVRAIDPAGRVEVYRLSGPVGLAQNLNRAIALSRGHLVHLLHQDDFVLPGFYARMRRAFMRAPMAGMAFCAAALVDREGRRLRRTSVPRVWSGLIRNWAAKIATRQRVQAPCAVVARTTYEEVGGFREDLRLALDWEMWVRIAVRYPVWCEVRALAAFRRHSESETERLKVEGAAWPDICLAIRINAQHCRSAGQTDRMSQSASWYLRSALREARREWTAGREVRAIHVVDQARSLLELVADPRDHVALGRRVDMVREQIAPGRQAANEGVRT